MTDNTGEETSNNLTNTQSENPPDEIIPAKDTETINLNHETENMEVHHHPDLHHKPKKWKEYFLEFLMIFLAVTMQEQLSYGKSLIGFLKQEYHLQ